MMKEKPEVAIFDVDGVLTDGSFYYTDKGKVMKKFGADDNDALKILSTYTKIVFVTGDRRGFDISRMRIEKDMHFELHLVSTIKRLDWIKEKFDPMKVVYMGDGIFDHVVMKGVIYSIAPKNSDDYTKSVASYVTKRNGGDRAVSEACLHIIQNFFDRDLSFLAPSQKSQVSGEWGI